MFGQMESERRKLIEAIITLVYFMRGSIQYDTMFEMTKVERDAVNEFIEGHLERESKRLYPQY